MSIQNSTLHNDFRALVIGGWDAVDPAVRDRMDRLLTADGDTIFVGHGCVRRSNVGWFYAQFCRAVGAPLVLKQGEDVETTVRVAPTKDGLRCWHRTFRFEDGSEQLVQTSKVIDPKLGLLDAVGPQGERRLATCLRVWTEGKSLHFASQAYFFRFRWFNLPVPSFLTPGRLIAEHRDLGDGSFVYILKFTHPIWGDTCYHEDIFRMQDAEI